MQAIFLPRRGGGHATRESWALPDPTLSSCRRVFRRLSQIPCMQCVSIRPSSAQLLGLCFFGALEIIVGVHEEKPSTLPAIDRTCLLQVLFRFAPQQFDAAHAAIPITWTRTIGASNHGKISEHCVRVGGFAWAAPFDQWSRQQACASPPRVNGIIEYGDWHRPTC